MGVNYSASVVVGFKVSLKDLTEEVKKFDENTGEPKTATKTIGNRVMSGDIILSDRPSVGRYHYQGDRVRGLELFGDGYDEVNQYVLGVEVAKTRDGHGVESFSNEIPDAVNAISIYHALPVEFVLVMSCG